MNAWLITGALIWSVLLGGGSFLYGQHVQSNADIAGQSKEEKKEDITADKKRKVSLQAGLRTEKAQASTETFFQNLNTDYETKKLVDPSIGCVLDPVSLRTWNDANTQSDSSAAGEPLDQVQSAPTAASGPERGTEPRPDGPVVP